MARPSGDDVIDAFCGHRNYAGRTGHLRSNLVLSGSANQRDWHSHGSGGAPDGCVAHGSAAGAGSSGERDLNRLIGRMDVDASAKRAVVWRDRHRSTDVSGGAGLSCWVERGGLLVASTASSEGGSGDGSEVRVSV